MRMKIWIGRNLKNIISRPGWNKDLMHICRRVSTLPLRLSPFSQNVPTPKKTAIFQNLGQIFCLYRHDTAKFSNYLLIYRFKILKKKKKMPKYCFFWVKNHKIPNLESLLIFIFFGKVPLRNCAPCDWVPISILDLEENFRMFKSLNVSLESGHEDYLQLISFDGNSLFKWRRRQIFLFLTVNDSEIKQKELNWNFKDIL